ncbi:8-oxo-dGTP diphosphatase [Nitrosomonas sp. Nm51]|uniref:Nudix family hydrolase n=1 Tax=Nitrosomonas sp. Nm51 TaxID=133720 RepID=UPI0008D69EF9|nr:Nudix family hydrolase [Nitrosomonas sp. Nm51]SER22659.1 8-oxo-dGTP diphosphatase [Nitrosomonas sp. Nm51]
MTTPRPAAVVDVAAAVIVQPDGRFLLTCRPEGKPYAGYWEFPGGKIEPGEAPLHALDRELQEELGIQILNAEPWITRNFTYSHAAVCLRFFRVTQWQGIPQAREHQQLAWQQPCRIAVSPMLPANAPVLRALLLPPVYAITQASEIGVSAALQQIEGALQHRLRMIQIREKAMKGEALRTFTEKVILLAHQAGAYVLRNSDTDMPHVSGLDGVHLTAPQLMALSERPALENGWCGASCHNREELYQAALLQVDFVVLGPVLSTLSHAGTAPMGWRKFAALIRDYPLPVYALGGMEPDDLSTARELGAHGVAMIRAISRL